MIKFILLGIFASAQISSKPLIIDEIETTVSNPKAKKPTTHTVPIAKERTVSSIPTKAEPKANRKAHAVVKKPSELEQQGNLPEYAVREETLEFANPTIQLKSDDFKRSSKLLVGDSLKAVIPNSIQVYADSQTPVVANVISGPFKGSLVTGIAYMDRTTKRAEIAIHNIRLPNEQRPYEVKGFVQDRNGQSGFEGRYETKFWNYFIAETLANTVSAAADATTAKTSGMFGNIVSPGPDSAVRQGIAGGMAKSGERIAERARSFPDYTLVEGPIDCYIIILN